VTVTLDISGRRHSNSAGKRQMRLLVRSDCRPTEPLGGFAAGRLKTGWSLFGGGAGCAHEQVTEVELHPDAVAVSPDHA
jgi:hypothetical protein